MDHMGPIPYSAQNGLLDGAFPRGALNYWKAQFVTELSDECIATLVDRFQQAPSPLCQIVIEHFHGAASRVPVEATACAMRITGYNVVIISQWLDGRDTDRGRQWARDTHAALQKFHAPMRYVNYLEEDINGDPAVSVYGQNHARLRQLKAKYDPENFFHVNVNIRP